MYNKKIFFVWINVIYLWDIVICCICCKRIFIPFGWIFLRSDPVCHTWLDVHSPEELPLASLSSSSFSSKTQREARSMASSVSRVNRNPRHRQQQRNRSVVAQGSVVQQLYWRSAGILSGCTDVLKGRRAERGGGNQELLQQLPVVLS